MCVVTREKLPKRDLIRVVLFDGKISVDVTGKQNGRGCYMKKDEAVIELAKKNKVNVIITPYDTFKTARTIILSNPIKNIRRAASAVCFNTQDYLSDFLDISNKLKHTNYPLLNNNGYLFC